MQRALPTRRQFLHAAAAGAGAVTAGCTLTAARSARVLGANDTLRLGVIGLRGRGRDHLAGFRNVPGVRIAALCDVDSSYLQKELAECQRRGEAVQAFADPRRLFEAGAVDAVSVATPNHWHALLGVWACQHGLDAYIEKPVSHDVWEGGQLVRAARKYDRVLATGTQCRSNPGMQQAIAFAQGGALGPIRLARGLCYKRRASIGKVDGEQTPPATVDYDLWLGPAPQQPLRRKQLHYDWHWQWDFGNGDLGNQGVHQMDLCRWAIGENELPPSVVSIGGRIGYDDDGQTPNTQLCWLGYRVPILFEVRGLPQRTGAKDMDRFLGPGIGAVLHCEHGYVVLDSYEGGAAFDHDGRQLQAWKQSGDHFQNFVDAVRARAPQQLSAEIEQGHLSAALCHLANDSVRQGQPADAARLRERLQWQPPLAEAMDRLLPHLRANDLDPARTPLHLGAWLAPDPDASRHPARDYRQPFALPAEV